MTTWKFESSINPKDIAEQSGRFAGVPYFSRMEVSRGGVVAVMIESGREVSKFLPMSDKTLADLGHKLLEIHAERDARDVLKRTRLINSLARSVKRWPDES
ncbi:hypothetical protein [Propionivibrio sp.]|uniref:hypothetical protein n=1 Tax=Propionivibrio sp. TaxID=2212460 RepID=UPI003BF25FDE